MKNNNVTRILLVFLCVFVCCTGCAKSNESVFDGVKNDLSTIVESITPNSEIRFDTSSSMTETELLNRDATVVITVPLTLEDYEIAVPSFLNEENKQLYLEAVKLYRIFAYDTTMLNSLFAPNWNDDSWRSVEMQEIGGRIFYACQGYYSDWDVFYNTMHRLFSETLAEELIDYNEYDLENSHFINLNGRTWFQVYERGGTPFYEPQISPETFELLLAEEERIEFMVNVPRVYSTFDDAGNITGYRTEAGDNYTIIMVKENGLWKFTQFRTPF